MNKKNINNHYTEDWKKLTLTLEEAEDRFYAMADAIEYAKQGFEGSLVRMKSGRLIALPDAKTSDTVVVVLPNTPKNKLKLVKK